MLSNRKSRRAGHPRPTRAGFGATVEAFEKRELLTGVGPFIQGTAFVDSSGTGTFTGSNAPLPGATISLYQGTTVSPSTFLESTTTDSNGNYLFFNNGQGGSDGIAAPVAGQTYTVVETAPSGYTLTSAQAISQLDVASVNSTSKSIQVTVAASEVTTTYNGPGNLDYLIGYSLNGNTESTYVAPILVTLSGTSVNPNQFATYCVDPLDNIGSVPYKVVTDPTTGLNPNGGKIGYLYNQYGGLTLPSTLPSGIQGQSYTAHEIQAGLQIAIWELEYPSSGSNPGFVLNQSGTSDYTNIQAIADAFITAANNAYPEQVGILDASLSGSVPSTTQPGQSPQIGQSLLAGESLNFGNNVSGSINGFDYLVSNTNQSATGLSGSTPNVPVVGTTVELFSGNSTTGTPLATTTTDGNGAYSFPNLPLGVYSVLEVAPTSDSHLGQTSSTTGATTSVGSSVTGITLSPTSLTSAENFFETVSVSVKGTDFLVPVGTTPTTSTTGTGLGGTSITITGTDEFGNVVNQTVNTSVTTGSSLGTYSFAGLNPSNAAGYAVTETIPTAYAHIGQTSTTTGAVYSVTGTPSSVSKLALTTNGATSTDNFFEYGAAISGTVYVDNNGNDSFGTGDTGIGNVTVYLYSVSGTTSTLVTTTQTSTGTNSPLGTYSFGNLPAGTYKVTETPPTGYTGESPNPGTSGGTPTFASNVEAISSISLGAGVNDISNNFGQYVPGSLSGIVYVDAGNTGSYVVGDTPLSGVKLTLVNSSGGTVTTTTAANGSYSFSNLTPGTYKVVEGAVSLIYSPDKTNTGSLSSIVVTSGANTPNNNFGEIPAGTDSISGTKYLDTTGNGLSCNQGPLSGDVPEAGVTINLYNSSTGALLESTVTAANGTYSFTGLPNGTYKVAEVLPAGTIQTGPTVVTGPYSSPSLGDSNFDQVCVGSGWWGYSYNTCGDSWTFGGHSGLASNGSAFTAGNPNSPSGNQVAFLQDTGCISQVVSAVNDGWYQFDFSDAKRGNGGGNQNFEILCDGNVVGTFSPTSTSYQACATPSFYLGSGSHTICIQGLDSCGGDNTAFLDKCSLVQNIGSVTEQSNGQAYYTVTVSTSTPTSTNNNFSNYAACNTSAISNISYKVTSTSRNWWDWGCGTTTTTSGPYSTLSGNTNPGNTVSATFTVTGSTSQMVSLVSYIVPYSGAPLSAQTVFALDSGTFTPGTHTVSVTLPTSAYQVDFVCGAAITQFGPSGSNVTYHGEQRFFSSDSDGWGCQSYVAPPLANVQSDIGSVGTPGTVAYNNGSYTLTASGSDFWNAADSGNYVYQTLNGNGEIVAKVNSISYTDSWAKAGLMIRQSLDPSSPQASVFATAGNGVVFQDRETQGGQSNSWSASNSYGCKANSGVWLKLVRQGNTITSYDSSNGVSWTEVGSDTINMSQPVYIGLAATAHNNCAVATATFDNVSTSGYWASCSGQSLIESFGGWSGSTCLSTWLAQNFGNLYGSKAGCNNLWGQSNNGVAAFCQSIEAIYGCESLEFQTLSTAIDEYATTWGLGGSIACNWGFDCNHSVASQWVNTSGSCSAFGTTTSNPWATCGSLLSFENSQASCGTFYAGNTNNHQLACNVIYQVGCCW